MKTIKEGEHYYVENGLRVFTEKFHLERGSCCGSGCRHCPYEPKHKKNNTKKKDFTKSK